MSDERVENKAATAREQRGWTTDLAIGLGPPAAAVAGAVANAIVNRPKPPPPPKVELPPGVRPSGGDD
jgi:hypothetical protein